MKPSLHRAIGHLPGLHVKEVEGDQQMHSLGMGGTTNDDYQGFCGIFLLFDFDNDDLRILWMLWKWKAVNHEHQRLTSGF